MPIQEITVDLTHDQSIGGDDSDIAYSDGSATDLESRSLEFYNLLVGASLITDAVDADTTFGDKVWVGASTDDWIVVNETGTVKELRFAADGSGTALDGDIWTDPVGTQVLTADTGDLIYLYAVDGGSVLVGSTTSPVSWGGTLPDSLSDFLTASIVIVAYLDAASDNKSAEIYLASFRPVVNPDPALADGDPVDLGDNVWLYGDTSQVLTFSGLDPKKFLFGLAGEDSTDGSANTKLFVLGENYNVDGNEDYEKGNTSGAMLNTSNAGKFDLFPEIDVATVGVDNQSVNPGQGIFIMLVNTDQPVGNYYDGNDADVLDDIQTQTTMGFGIVQAVGDTNAIQIEISGYDGNFTDGANLIADNGGDGPDMTLGAPADRIGLVSITVRSPLGEATVAFVSGASQSLTISGRTILVEFSGNDGAGNPTLATLTGVAAQDLITATWVDEVDHVLLHTNTGAIDWGIVSGQLGGDISSNVGQHMLIDDDGPTADVNNDGTDPAPRYLFEGNTTLLGNFQGDGTGGDTSASTPASPPTSTTVDFSGAFTTAHEYGTDGEKSTVPAYTPILNVAIGSAVMMVKGVEPSAQAESGGVGLVWAEATGGYAATAGAGGAEIFQITVNATTGVVTFALSGVIDHPDADTAAPFTDDILTLDNNQIAIRRTDTITDNDDDTDSDFADVDLGGNFGIGDDAPLVDVTLDVGDGDIAALGVNLDETIDPDDDATPDGADNFASGETESTSSIYPLAVSNGDLDDVIVGGVANRPVYKTDPGGYNNAGEDSVDQAIGRLSSSAGEISALFGTPVVRYGADGAGSTAHLLTFDLSGTGPVETNLVATAVVGSALDGVAEASRKVYLFEVADTGGDITVIEGRVMGSDGAWGTGDDFVIIRMSLTNKTDPDNATIVYENFAPVQNPDILLKDEAIGLFIPNGETLSIVYSVDADDYDGDAGSDSESVVLVDHDTTILEIDDDGPRTAGSGDTVDLWEDALPLTGRTDDDGETEVVTNAGSLLDQVTAGTDGVKNFGLTTVPAFITALNGLAHSSGGTDLVWSVIHDTDPDGDDILTAKAGEDGADIIVVTVEEDGGYTIELKGPLDHPQSLLDQPDEDVIIIDFTAGLVAYEGDNDPVSFQPGALRARIEDDAPRISSDGVLTDVPDLTFVKDDTETVDEDIAYGADGAGSFKITSVTAVNTAADTVLGTISSIIATDGSSVKYYSTYLDAQDGDQGEGAFLEITLDQDTGDYTATVLADAPLIEIPLIGGSTTPGGPVEEFTPDPPGDIVTFDGYIFTDWDADAGDSLKYQFFPGGGDNNDPVNSGASNEDINIDTNGIGLENAVMNEGEGLLMSFTEPVAGVSIDFAGPTGGLSVFRLRLEAYDADGNLVEARTLTEAEALAAPKGNSILSYDFVASGAFTTLYISTDLEGNDAIRIPEISAFSYANIDDLAGKVNVELTDFDGDTDTSSFDWAIDGDGDGSITLPV